MTQGKDGKTPTIGPGWQIVHFLETGAIRFRYRDEDGDTSFLRFPGGEDKAPLPFMNEDEFIKLAGMIAHLEGLEIANVRESNDTYIFEFTERA